MSGFLGQNEIPVPVNGDVEQICVAVGGGGGAMVD